MLLSGGRLLRPPKTAYVLAGFSSERIEVDGLSINVTRGGHGPPVLLLHGYPQTHVMWHRVAPPLARRHTVVCPDLRGYGDSDKPPGGGDHAEYAKRAMAADQIGVMRSLGFDSFAVVGHDRGARVALRMALDHPMPSNDSRSWTSSLAGPSTRPSTATGRRRCGATSS